MADLSSTKEEASIDDPKSSDELFSDSINAKMEQSVSDEEIDQSENQKDEESSLDAGNEEMESTLSGEEDDSRNNQKEEGSSSEAENEKMELTLSEEEDASQNCQKETLSPDAGKEEVKTTLPEEEEDSAINQKEEESLSDTGNEKIEDLLLTEDVSSGSQKSEDILADGQSAKIGNSLIEDVQPSGETVGEKRSAEDENDTLIKRQKTDQESPESPKTKENGEKELQVEVVASGSKKSDIPSVECYMNEAYNDLDFIKSFSESFNEKKKTTFDNGASLLNEPFTCCALNGFMQPENFVNNLIEEISELDVEFKLNDLYQFKQSHDLGDCKSPNIEALRKVLYGECLEWMKKVTHIPLNDKVDMSCSCYTYTDHLLCHDDELEGRRIAYIYYLVPDFTEKDGGALELFKTEDGQPTNVSTRIVPLMNNFIFFEVSPVSYHQVSEILAFKTRTSISGWFHGPPIKASVPLKETQIFRPPLDEDIDFEDWINPTYLDPESQLEICETFEESSEIELQDFFQEEKYSQLCDAFFRMDINWEVKGPPNRRKTEEASENTLPLILQMFHKLFHSEIFFLILSNLTGLKLHAASEESKGMGEVMTSIRRWRHGSYTLLHDQSFAKTPLLNVSVCFNCKDWNSECGGYTGYVAENEKEELLRIDPKPNSLALVYITEGTSHFIKYINCKSKKGKLPIFHDIFSTYKEKK